MSEVTVKIDGLKDLEARFDPVRARRLLSEGVFRGLVLTGNSARRKLSGPVLKNQTGTLRRSIHERLEEAAEYIKGVVGSFAGYVNPKGGGEAAGYARLHEYGGTFEVPAHERRIGYNADSERIRLLTKAGGIKKGVANYSVVQVKAHKITFPERSFLRSSLKDEQKKIVKELRYSMNQALSGK